MKNRIHLHPAGRLPLPAPLTAGLLLLLVGFSACQDWDLVRINVPEVITAAEVLPGANPTEATLGGEIQGMLDNTSVDEHGHLWSETNADPTLEDDVAYTRLNRRNNGPFQSQVEGLNPGRRIYYRAYAIYEDKKSYGAVLSYTPADISLQWQTEQISSTREQAISRLTLRSVVSGLPVPLDLKSYGVVWSAQKDPTIEADKLTADGSNILHNAPEITFESTLSNLSHGVYYARPYLAVAGLVYYGPNVCLTPGDFIEERNIAGAPDPNCRYLPLSIGEQVYFIGYSRLGCSSWSYDPQTNRFSAKAGFPGIPRAFEKTAVANGKAYLGFGISGPPDLLMADLWEYDPAIDQWTEQAPLVSGRYEPIFFAVGDYLYAGSGQEPPPPGSNDPWTQAYDFWRFDPAAGTWTPLGDAPGINTYGSMSFALGGKGFMLGVGSGFWEYLPQTDTWNEKPLAIPELTYGVPNLDGIIAGKAYVTANEYRLRYDPLADTWTYIAEGFEPRSFAGLGSFGYSLTPGGIGVYYPPGECQ